MPLRPAAAAAAVIQQTNETNKQTIEFNISKAAQVAS